MLSISKKEIKKILKNNKAHPLKQLGQNFLIDKNILSKIINTSSNNIIMITHVG